MLEICCVATTFYDCFSPHACHTIKTHRNLLCEAFPVLVYACQIKLHLLNFCLSNCCPKQKKQQHVVHWSLFLKGRHRFFDTWLSQRTAKASHILSHDNAGDRIHNDSIQSYSKRILRHVSFSFLLASVPDELGWIISVLRNEEVSQESLLDSNPLGKRWNILAVPSLFLPLMVAHVVDGGLCVTPCSLLCL